MVEQPTRNLTILDYSRIQIVVRVACLLTAIGGGATLYYQHSIPSEIASSILFGMSGLRLVIFLFILTFSITALYLFSLSLIKQETFNQKVIRLAEKFAPQKAWTVSMAVCLFIFLTGCFFITLTPEVQEPFTRAYFDRLMPAVLWLTFVFAQAVIFLLLVHFGADISTWLPKSRAFYISLVVFITFFLGWIFIARDQLPTETKITGWNITSAPVLDTQVLVAWLAGVIFIFLWHLLLEKYPDISKNRLLIIKKIDLLVFLIFWFTSVILWLSIPIHSNWFISEPTQPNLEHYPTSDARVYDITAQTAMVGAGYQFFETPFIRRPLHAAYLTLLHQISGQDYQSVVSLQVLILAFLPSFIYLLASSLHDRGAGVIAAVMILFREANSIAISGRITTSHAKELLVDLPTTLGIVIFSFVVIHWFKDFKKRRIYALVAGGILGAVLLIRLEMILSLLIITIIAWLISKASNGLGSWIRAILLVFLGLTVVIIPWIYRNWMLTGRFFLDSPLWRTDLLQQRFHSLPATPTLAPTAVVIQPTDATVPLSTPSSEYISPIPPLTQSGQQHTPIATMATFEDESRRAFQFIISHPSQVTRYIVTHYLNSQMQSFLILPSTVRILDSTTALLGHRSAQRFWYSCCSAIEYIRRMPYWRQWDGDFPSQAIIPLSINLIMIAVGISAAWSKHRWTGLLPALIGIGHFLLNAFFRNSGGRYILPVDWVGIVYFSAGLSQFTTRFMRVFLDSSGIENWDKDQDVLAEKSPGGTFTRQRPVLITLTGVFLLLGLTVPVIEIAFKPTFTDNRRQEMIHLMVQSETIPEKEKKFMQEFISNGGEFVVGRGMYPEYLPAYTTDVAKYKYLPANYPRLSFYLVGAESMVILMPIKIRPKFFPNSAEVVVLGCPVVYTPQGIRRIEALYVGVLGNSGLLETIIKRYPQPAIPQCPLPYPETATQGSGP